MESCKRPSGKDASDYTLKCQTATIRCNDILLDEILILKLPEGDLFSFKQFFFHSCSNNA